MLQNDIDLLHPPAELEKRKHKLKRLVQCPNSFFMVLLLIIRCSMPFWDICFFLFDSDFLEKILILIVLNMHRTLSAKDASTCK